MCKSLGFVLLGLVAAAAEVRAAEERKPLVFVSIPPQRWVVRELAGDRVDVELVLPGGQNPHLYEPSARQAIALSRADLCLLLGLPFEKQVMAKALAARPNLRQVTLAAGVPRLGGAHEHEHDHAPGAACSQDGTDPHIWLAPGPMQVIAVETAQALMTVDSAGAARYPAALERLTNRIERLTRELRTTLAPHPGGLVVVYHPSWGYFAEAFGLEQVAVEDEGRAPPARQLARLIERARTAGVKTVFTEPQFDRRPAETLARQLNGRVVIVDPLAEDWEANLRQVGAQFARALAEAQGPPGRPAASRPPEARSP